LTILDLAIKRGPHTEPLSFPVRRVINSMYCGRNKADVQSHIEELCKEGVKPPGSVPLFVPISPYLMTTGDEIQVQRAATSGEVEYLLLIHDDGEVYVGLVSDHTDREIERLDLPASKQLCSKVVARDVWRLSDVENGWDNLVMSSWALKGKRKVCYQSSSLACLLPPNRLLELVKGNTVDGLQGGTAILSGTIPISNGEIVYAERFEASLLDTRSDSELRLAYAISTFPWFKIQPQQPN